MSKAMVEALSHIVVTLQPCLYGPDLEITQLTIRIYKWATSNFHPHNNL